jgi:hypothetical protein
MSPTTSVARFQRGFQALAVGAALVLGACSESGVTDPAPLIVDEGPGFERVMSASWVVDANLIDETITITPPTSGLSQSRVMADYFGVDPEADLSLVGGDVIDVLPVGGTLDFAPANLASGRRRVAFEIQVQNKLSGTALKAPEEFPAPPAGVTSPVIFSFRNVVTTTTGGVTGQQGQGNGVIVETPNEGTVISSDSIWQGPPHNFFNETACGSATGEVDQSTDCFLYLPIVEEATLSDTILGLATSEPIRVGYDLELTVNNFRSNLIVGADLIDASPNALPTATFAVTGTPFNGVPLSLDATGSSDSDGFIVSYQWDDGGAGGSFSDPTSPNPTYTAAGTGSQSIDLSVVVTDNRGGQDTSTQTLTFTDPPSDISVASSAPASAQTGTVYTIELTVEELLGGQALSVGLTDIIPAGATLVPGSITGGGTESGGTITWALGDIAGLGSTTVSYQVTAGAAGSVETNDANVTSTNDSNAANNAASSSVNVTAAANVLGRWVVVSSSLYPAGTSLSEGDPVNNGDVLEFQVCFLGFNFNAAEIETTWDPAEVSLGASATLFQSTDANAHADCVDTTDELNEFFAAGPAGQNINNKAAAIDLTNPGIDYTAGLARYEFTVAGSAGGSITVTPSGPVAGDHVLGDVSSSLVVDYDGLTIN